MINQSLSIFSILAPKWPHRPRSTFESPLCAHLPHPPLNQPSRIWRQFATN
jgi:hypothetical protein